MVGAVLTGQQLDWALILLGLALYLLNASVYSVFVVLYIFDFFLHSLSFSGLILDLVD